MSRLRAAGFNLKQLKDAGFDAADLKSNEFDAKELKQAGFSAEELKKAGYDFSTLKAIGFQPEQLKAAGFAVPEFRRNAYTAADLRKFGFTAKELSSVSSATNDEDTSHMSQKHYDEISELIDGRIRSGRIFGETWRDFLGFFAPFGTKNCFWKRLKDSPMLRHIFVHDSNFINKMKTKSLLEEAPSPQITASDVDSTVNNCALICALLISIPAGVISDMGQSDFYVNFISSGKFVGYPSRNCTTEMTKDVAFLKECIVPFKESYTVLTFYSLASFYTNIFCLLMAVLYYMCRPSDSYKISSSLTLLEAFTMEVRKRIRQERHQKETDPGSKKKPNDPFENPLVEFEVFSRATFYAQNESEEQNNQEFYAWYKSKLMHTRFAIYFERLYYALTDSHLGRRQTFCHRNLFRLARIALYHILFYQCVHVIRCENLRRFPIFLSGLGKLYGTNCLQNLHNQFSTCVLHHSLFLVRLHINARCSICILNQ